MLSTCRFRHKKNVASLPLRGLPEGSNTAVAVQGGAASSHFVFRRPPFQRSGGGVFPRDDFDSSGEDFDSSRARASSSRVDSISSRVQRVFTREDFISSRVKTASTRAELVFTRVSVVRSPGPIAFFPGFPPISREICVFLVCDPSVAPVVSRWHGQNHVATDRPTARAEDLHLQVPARGMRNKKPRATTSREAALLQTFVSRACAVRTARRSNPACPGSNPPRRRCSWSPGRGT